MCDTKQTIKWSIFKKPIVSNIVAESHWTSSATARAASAAAEQAAATWRREFLGVIIVTHRVRYNEPLHDVSRCASRQVVADDWQLAVDVEVCPARLKSAVQWPQPVHSTFDPGTLGSFSASDQRRQFFYHLDHTTAHLTPEGDG